MLKQKSNRYNVILVCKLVSPFIVLLFNKSQTAGYFRSEFKEAVVRQLLKKIGLNASDLKNYRSMSKLSFLSVSC